MPTNNKIMRVGPGTLTLSLSDSSPLDFAGQVSKTEVVPSTSSGGQREMLNGDTVDEGVTYAWVFKATAEQNLTAKGLAGFVLANVGKIAKLSFCPSTVDGAKWDGDVRLDPSAIGGDVGKANTTDFEFPFIGQPKFTPATKAGGLAP